MSDVVRLVPNNALCIDQAGLAERLRAMAERIEAGEFGEIERVIVLLDTPDGVQRRVYGRQCNVAELVGLLEFAKHRAISPPPDED